VFETSLRAGNEGRRLRLRLARARLALHRVHLRHAHRRHPPPTLLPPPPPTADPAAGGAVAAAATAAAAAAATARVATAAGSGGAGAPLPVSLGVFALLAMPPQHTHLPLLAPRAPCPVPLGAASEVSRRHVERARRDLAHVLAYCVDLRRHPLTLFEAATVGRQQLHARLALGCPWLLPRASADDANACVYCCCC
jgi:hypothetical protein